ncbi:uncharacterized protein LOC134812270 [Bolinopsis microptera]|uniref:uncharacterized protein LOC134812270 n=1 Tax=Bolinopsis microptera TaxID=2820187 RepID=UPI00307AE6EC
MNHTPLWFCFILSTIGKSGLCVELVVKECLNKVCKNVNLSDSVVILRPEQSQGKTLIHFKDSITDSNLIDLFWERSTKKLSFGLVSEASQAIGGLIEYDSMPSNGDDSDDSYDCSIAFHEDHLKVFIDGFPSAAWNLSDSTISEGDKTKMSEKINVDFTSISDLSERIYISGRCSEGYHINIANEKCLSCSTQETSYGTGMTKICTDFEKMMDFCGSTVCSAYLYCPKSVTLTPYGSFTWPVSLVSTTAQELPCQYDDSFKVRRVCSANNTWEEVDTTDCVKTSLTARLQTILDSSSSSNVDQTRQDFVELQHADESQNIGKGDLLLSYDILNTITRRGDGHVTYETAIAVLDTLTFISKSHSCHNDPSCFWMMELLREVVPRVENKTVLILSDNIGLFHLQDMLAVINMHKFCRNTFHDMITGCENDRLSFLKIMRNELDRLVDGSRRDNVSLSLIFLNSDTFFPHETEILPAHEFNETLQNYKTGKQQPQDDVQTIASMVVDLNVQGLPNNTDTNFFFELYDNTAYKSKDRMFNAIWNESRLTYQIKYVCALYETNTTRDRYLEEKGEVWDKDKSTISADGLVDQKTILKDKSLLGVWNTQICETTFDKFSDDPIIRCNCRQTSGAFTVLAMITRKEWPEHYAEILISVTGICLLGIAMGLLIIFIPAKWMGIPKTTKINVAVIMVLLLVALYFMIKKMAEEFGNFHF